ncbi:helix-turn-helix domain-containing protein [Lactococcus lactis]|uniref:helix-turn-helix domain-containing protein n=1 Tax=Lactococcus lactis TaxID=1358 RepID=UPI002659FBEB|nr:helix-turn-helix domain-containing protein [Lactococcus lactis]WKF72350.1 helix-turn-helix domain-containing protein [Lactococcus lactis]
MFKTNDELPLERLFSKEIKIKLKLLNELYRNVDGFTVESLATKTTLSSKTIYKYLRDINKLSSNYYGEICVNISPNNNNYYFQGDKIKFLTLRFLIIESCASIQLLLALIPKSSVNKYEFCSRFYLSESTLKNYIRAINSLLEYLDIRLTTRKNEIYLVGDEVIVRYCFSSILWRTYNGLKWPFESFFSTKKLLELNKLLYKNPELTISLGKQSIFLTQMAVNILRVKSSHIITEQQLPIYTKELTKDFQYLKEFKKALKEEFYFRDVEINFIILNLYLSPEQLGIYSRNLLTFTILKNKNLPAFNSSKQFIEIVQKKYPLWDADSTKGQIFIAAVLSAHIATDIYKKACFNMQDLDLINFASNEFPLLLPSINNITRSINPTLPEDIIKPLAFQLTKAYLLSFSPISFEPQINILLATDSPNFVERGTISQINSIFKYKYNLNISTDPSEISNIDLVISTGLYPGMPKDISTIYVFPQIIERDAQKIKEACEKIYKEKANSILNGFNHNSKQ